jgi:phosphoglycerol transferase
VIATKRNSMDNGATVLDILGGDNFIGLGRSTLSGQSLSEVFLNMKEKSSPGSRTSSACGTSRKR